MSEPILIAFPLPNGNSFELRLKKPVTKRDFECIEELLQLAEDSLVEPDCRAAQPTTDVQP